MDLHLCPVNGVVVLGPPLSVGVLHQWQVSQSCAPFGRCLLPGGPPQQAHRHVGSVVVLKGDFFDLEHRQGEVLTKYTYYLIFFYTMKRTQGLRFKHHPETSFIINIINRTIKLEAFFVMVLIVWWLPQ